MRDKNSNSRSLELFAGLMIEAANTDGIIEDKEIEKISNSLIILLVKICQKLKKLWIKQ